MIAAADQQIRRNKLTRLKSGAAPRALEICSGSGGLSLGLKTAGFDLTAHIEIDNEAARSYALNFGGDRSADDPWRLPRDMVACSAHDLVTELGLSTSAADSFDLLAAGLPCQAFARIGRSKLRSVAGHDDAFQRDPRASLYRRFLQYVHDTQPLAILIENVPDILNFGGHNVPEEICETLEAVGYRTGYTILNAAHFGVPQIRERLFIIALADITGLKPAFPEPTHSLVLPRGYEGSRKVALKYVDRTSGRFHEIHEPPANLPVAVGTRDALDDLPEIGEHRTDPSTIRRRRLSDQLPYRTSAKALSAYATTMRTWPGFETSDSASSHLVRLTPRDFPIFAKMKHGDDYPRAREVAECLFRKALIQQGNSPRYTKSAAYTALWAAMVPPYDPDKFPNKWWKLDPLKPSRTLTAHMGKDTYSHIHYDHRQARTISVREAARLQSFPDGFEFAGAMNAAFRQIGNAVPPLLGLAVAKVLRRQLVESTIEKADDRQVA
ncbi:DNA cytosine methyltransferase [Burkholderia cepacia]|uniref:DNA cytosine methyltransferase n=1 Tax=Burkholderia cepacia TaxID=292 RepID=UPI0026526992|nr:DNA cytosine methyltransferase [Burkholderia cepacia]MDN7915349.1 DNA cytosine methyltransferase [Burkholderia cepacia]